MLSFTADTKTLIDVLTMAKTAIDAKLKIPILGCVLVESIDESYIRITSTNLELAIRQTMPATVTAAGSACISFRQLIDGLKGMDKKQPVTLVANDKGATVTQKVFYAVWSPSREDLAVSMCGQIDDEDTSLVERAEARAERFENYSERRAKDAAAVAGHVERIASAIPFGQPILIGHHSERRARKDAQRIQDGTRKAVQLWKTSEYWLSRAAGALRHAKYKESPTVRARRIRTIESEMRVQRASFTPKTDKAGNVIVTMSEPWSKSDGVKVPHVWIGNGSRGAHPVEQSRIPAIRAYAERWIAHLENRLAYERAMLGEQGGIITDHVQEMKAGGRVRVGGSWYTVERVNVGAEGRPVSVSIVKPEAFQGRWFRRVIEVEHIAEYQAPTAETAAAVKAKNAAPPILNYDGPGFRHMTMAQWKAKYTEYKSTLEVGKGARAPRNYADVTKEKRAELEQYAPHRIRVAQLGSYRDGWTPVFITDAKVTAPKPAPAAEPEPVADQVEPMPEPAAVEPAAVEPEPEYNAPMSSENSAPVAEPEPAHAAPAAESGEMTTARAIESLARTFDGVAAIVAAENPTATEEERYQMTKAVMFRGLGIEEKPATITTATSTAENPPAAVTVAAMDEPSYEAKPAPAGKPKKITVATVKAFIRKNRERLHIRVRSSFDAMTDGVEHTGAKEFTPAKHTERWDKEAARFVPGDLENAHNMGVNGVWFVGGSRDYCSAITEGDWQGFAVSNSCGSWAVAVRAGGDNPPEPPKREGVCVACGKSTRRAPDDSRPCCNSCEKTAPVAISCPNAFSRGVAGKVAEAAKQQARRVVRDVVTVPDMDTAREVLENLPDGYTGKATPRESGGVTVLYQAPSEYKCPMSSQNSSGDHMADYRAQWRGKLRTALEMELRGLEAFERKALNFGMGANLGKPGDGGALDKMEVLRELIAEKAPRPERPAALDRLTKPAAAPVVVSRDTELFVTPDHLARRMAEIAATAEPTGRPCDDPAIRPGLRFLEPSAGTGALVVAMEAEAKAHGYRLETMAVEKHMELSRRLNERFDASVINRDFLDLKPGDFKPFDCVVMNPPFSNLQDVDHVRHAWEFVRPGGVLVAIMSPAWQYHERTKAREFREWIEETGAEVEELPAGTFAHTAARSVLVTAWKGV